MRMNPVLENEMKRNMRSMKSSWIIFGVNFLLTIVAVITYFGVSSKNNYMTAGQFRYSVQCYMMMGYALFAMVCVLVPGVAGGSIAIERERRTLDLLLTTHLNPWKIIIGKLESSLCLIFLIAFASLPAVSLILVFGGVSFIDLFILVVILVVSGIFIGSIGIFFSAIFRKTTVATIASYVAVILLVGGTVVILGVAHYVLNVRAEQMGNYDGITMGPWIYIVWLNPLVIYFGMLTKQVGSGYELLQVCNQIGKYNNDLGVTHMLVIAVVLQLLISALLLFLAGRHINPLRK